MSLYAIGQTVYYVQYVGGVPFLTSYLIASIRENAEGFSYSKFENAASPLMAEADLFLTPSLAVAHEVSMLEALIQI